MGSPYFSVSHTDSALHGTEFVRSVPAYSIHNMIKIMRMRTPGANVTVNIYTALLNIKFKGCKAHLNILTNLCVLELSALFLDATDFILKIFVIRVILLVT
jgi:hypothetical protein